MFYFLFFRKERVEMVHFVAAALPSHRCRLHVVRIDLCAAGSSMGRGSRTTVLIVRDSGCCGQCSMSSGLWRRAVGPTVTDGYKEGNAVTFWHRSFIFNSNKSPTWCNSFSVYCPDVCLQLNMFRAFSRPSSGAQW